MIRVIEMKKLCRPHRWKAPGIAGFWVGPKGFVLVRQQPRTQECAGCGKPKFSAELEACRGRA